MFGDYLAGFGVVGTWMVPSASGLLTDVEKLHPKWHLLDWRLVVGRKKLAITIVLMQGIRVICVLEDQAVWIVTEVRRHNLWHLQFYRPFSGLGHRSFAKLSGTDWKDLQFDGKLVSALANSSEQRTRTVADGFWSVIYDLATITCFTPARGIIRWLWLNKTDTIDAREESECDKNEGISSARCAPQTTRNLMFQLSRILKLLKLKVLVYRYKKRFRHLICALY